MHRCGTGGERAGCVSSGSWRSLATTTNRLPAFFLVPFPPFSVFCTKQPEWSFKNVNQIISLPFFKTTSTTTSHWLQHVLKVKSAVLTLAHKALRGLNWLPLWFQLHHSQPFPVLPPLWGFCLWAGWTHSFLKDLTFHLLWFDPFPPYFFLAVSSLTGQLILPCSCVGSCLPQSASGYFTTFFLHSNYHYLKWFCVFICVKSVFNFFSLAWELSLPCLVQCLPQCRHSTNVPQIFSEETIPVTAGVWKVRSPPIPRRISG